MRAPLEAALALSSEGFALSPQWDRQSRLSVGPYSPQPFAEPTPTLLRMPSREQLLSLANCGQRLLRPVSSAARASDRAVAANAVPSPSLARRSTSTRPVARDTPPRKQLAPVARSTPVHSKNTSAESRQTSGTELENKSVQPLMQFGDTARIRSESGSSASAGGTRSGSRSVSKSAEVDADETDIDVDWDELSEALEPTGSASGSVSALEQVGLGMNTPSMNRKYLFTPIATPTNAQQLHQSPPCEAQRLRAEHIGSVPRVVAKVTDREQSGTSGPRAAAAAAAIASSMSAAAVGPRTEATGRFQSDSGTVLTPESSPASTRTSPQSLATASSSKASSLQQSPSAARPHSSAAAAASEIGASSFPFESARSSSSNIPEGLQAADTSYAFLISYKL